MDNVKRTKQRPTGHAFERMVKKMNYMKLQMDLLKAADARDGWKHRPFKALWFETDDRVFICPESTWMMGVFKDRFFLDISKIFKDTLPLITGEKLLKSGQNTKPAEDTHIIIDAVVHNKKRKLHKFTVDDKPVYVQEDVLRYFEMDYSRFTGTDSISPLFVWENDDIIGLILPVNYKEK